MTKPYLVVTFQGCEVRIWPSEHYLETVFPDGSKVPAAPQDNQEYRDKAIRFGYGPNVFAMCVHHELCHHIYAESIGRPFSPTLWAVAHGVTGDHEEEMAVAVLQQRFRQILDIQFNSENLDGSIPVVS